ncbi:hypothetical protein [Fimbriimonas ginsengisoli]|uniref:hypothetical protein n=1 Tax=Fimbriimonas ginsengisoli TaxID=1005039 RepID=UPI00130DE762|nr:hypothetical protein [Fimbriimonas ginsengisoli]
MLVAGWVACAVFLGGYGVFTAAITAYVVFSVAATGVPERERGGLANALHREQARRARR